MILMSAIYYWENLGDVRLMASMIKKKNLYLFSWEGRRIAIVPPKVTPQLPKPEVKVEEKIVKAEVVDEHIKKIQDLQSYKQHDDKISTLLCETTNKVVLDGIRLMDDCDCGRDSSHMDVDLVDLPGKKNIQTSRMVEEVQATHEVVRANITESNAKYKFTANKHLRKKLFQVGDEWTELSSSWYPILSSELPSSSRKRSRPLSPSLPPSVPPPPKHVKSVGDNIEAII
ncbi:hypothetical protein Tco_0186143 [Tanacetum coccineum]